MKAKRQDVTQSANMMSLAVFQMATSDEKLLAANPTTSSDTPNQIGDAEHGQ